jgi:NAD(P)-dependent dehydrogenase (short-subunit alcohol dehydrogenase family)
MNEALRHSYQTTTRWDMRQMSDSFLAGLSLNGRRALITGAGTGIGQMIALGYAQAGADLVLVGRRAAPLELTAAAARKFGAVVEVIPADVTAEGDIERIQDKAGCIDILVNNAGIAPKHPWKSVPLSEWRAVFDLNVDAVFRLCQLFAPAMAERGWGRIINISSIYGGLGGNPTLYPGIEWDEPAYFASKHAVHGITRYLATRLASSGVSINSLSPGAFSGSEQNIKAGLSSPEILRVQYEAIPMRRFGGAEDIQGVAVFLGSPSAAFLTGQNIIVDGGFTVW